MNVHRFAAIKNKLGFGLSLAAVLGVACSTSSSNAPTPAVTGDIPCDVDTVLANNCRKCHSSPPQFGAPMPLLSLEDLHADAKVTAGKKVFEMVGTRIHDDASPMPQPPNPRLSAPDTATLDAWIAAGAPAGQKCGTAPDAGSAQPDTLSCSPDQFIRPASKFAMPDVPEIYVCYGFDTVASQKRHVIAAAPRIDNTNLVHHVLVYESANAISSTPTPCEGAGRADWRLVTGWAPGGRNFELPPEAGFAEEAGTTHWVVQIHYNNAQGLKEQLDGTGYDLCSTDQLRPNDADVFATGTMEIQIPPRSTYETTCDLAVAKELGKINIVSTWAHMHRLGKAQSAVRIRNGEEKVLLDSPNYDFSTGAVPFPANTDVASGDVIRTKCRWKNPTDSTVGFGEKTTDEMCYAFMTYYPKITLPNFTWQVPTTPIFSTCTGTTL